MDYLRVDRNLQYKRLLEKYEAKRRAFSNLQEIANEIAAAYETAGKQLEYTLEIPGRSELVTWEEIFGVLKDSLVYRNPEFEGLTHKCNHISF